MSAPRRTVSPEVEVAKARQLKKGVMQERLTGTRLI